ncbi:hypothetical protein [Sphaerotilus sp.]|uniref:hypothetical protein n=1 Tax=Sphaerotilus sp. TaxID=2093942 RepID=UPI002ACD27BB|nr:hypothetical protein [Sphaerotilus sp.]MDZ7855851.1 hypothetical protein [Sphaerotilus sp.]
MNKGHVTLRFESRLPVPQSLLWQWITSVEGIRAELWPLMRMTLPRGVRSLADLPATPGVPLFRSWILLAGVLPIDHSDLTLQEINPGHGFVEQSAMGSMALWRHERRIVVDAGGPGTVLLVDELNFRPRLARRLVAWFVHRLFEHRHAVLRARAARYRGPT